MNKPLARLLATAAALVATIAIPETARAGTSTFDFDLDPTAELGVNSNNPNYWTPFDGNPGGFLSITDAVGSQYSNIIFPDVDNGAVVKAFSFSMDVRAGNGTTERPADGFSVNYARANDPVLQAYADDPTQSLNAFFASTQPESGTTTGLAISFDAWDGNPLPDNPPGGDVEGIIVRVDNVTILQEPLPVRHGACEDPQSLQTGPSDQTGFYDDLCWQPLEVELAEDGKLTVMWKGEVILDQYQTTFFPSAGQLILAGRTGGSNQNQHIDNIQITTIPAESVLVTGITGHPDSFELEFTGSAAAQLDVDSIQATLDGQPVALTSSSASGEITTAIFETGLLDPGVEHEVSVTFADQNGNSDTVVRTYTVPAWTRIPGSWAMPSSVGADPGFTFTVHQNAALTDTTVQRAIDQLNSDLIDPAVGEPYENLADTFVQGPAINTPALPNPLWLPVTYEIPTVINLSQLEGETNGRFTPDEQMPGIPGVFGETDGIAASIETYISFSEAGLYTMVVNSDDGFRTTASARHPQDATGLNLGEFNAGRGASDTVFQFYIEEPGIYPFRTIWFEGGGGANVEWFTVQDDGTRVLLNDTANGGLPAFRSISAPQPYITSATPARGATGVGGVADIAIEITDNGDSVDQGSVQVSVNGEAIQANVSKSGGVTTVEGSTGLLDPESESTISLSFTAGGTAHTATWDFTVADYETLPAGIASEVGSGSNPGFNVRVWQLAPTGSVGAPNRIHFAEQQLAGLFGPNVADLTGAQDGVFSVDVINWEQDGADIGNFSPEDFIPGIPGTTDSTDNIAAEIETYVEFPSAGYYVMGVNSDDGFRVSPTEEPGRYPLVIESPASIAGPIGALSSGPEGGQNAAPLPTTPITAEVVLAEPADATSDLTNAAEINGNIALIDRGAITFNEKIQRAIDAGAVAVIMVNNRDAASAEGVLPIGMGSLSAVDIPAVMITLDDGAALKAALASGTVTASIGADTTLTLGEFNAGRGSSNSEFGFYVPAPGVYPMRLIWFEGGGGANVEWYTINDNGDRVLLNGSDAGALKAYQERTAPQGEPTISISRTGNQITIVWENGTLQSADAVTGPWSAESGASPKVIGNPTGTKFYRVQ